MTLKQVLQEVLEEGEWQGSEVTQDSGALKGSKVNFSTSLLLTFDQADHSPARAAQILTKAGQTPVPPGDGGWGHRACLRSDHLSFFSFCSSHFAGQKGELGEQGQTGPSGFAGMKGARGFKGVLNSEGLRCTSNLEELLSPVGGAANPPWKGQLGF